MSKFLGYTVGLEAMGEAHKGLVKVEFNEATNGDIEARLVSGINLGHIPKAGNVKIAKAEYDDRPSDDIERAEWAFKKFGLSIIGREAI